MSEKPHKESHSNLTSAFTQDEKASEQKTKHSVRGDSLEEISKLEAQITELKDALVRSLAENDNLKKRHTKDLESTVKFGATNILKDLTEPFEQLFMALAVNVDEGIKNNTSFKSIIDGIAITRKAFEVSFEKHGLKRIYPKNEKFDHNLHQAISQMQQDGVESGTVIDVIQAGYTLNERVIKPAMVVVSV
jgi:molecular chaperone GrpE